MVDALYEASQAGAEIDLIVRNPVAASGYPGSVRADHRPFARRPVPRALGSSGSACGVEATHIGSADLMQRNLDRRVEALVPVSDPSLAARLDEILDVLMQDDMLSWTLGSDGTWTKVRGDEDRRAAASPGAGGRARGVARGVVRRPRRRTSSGAKLRRPPGSASRTWAATGWSRPGWTPAARHGLRGHPDLRIARWGAACDTDRARATTTDGRSSSRHRPTDHSSSGPR